MKASPQRPPVSASQGRWGDLGPRVLTSAVLAGAGLGAIWLGGFYFILFVGAAVTALTWELARMVLASQSALLAGLAGAALLSLAILPEGYALPLVIVPVLAGINGLGRERLSYALFCVLFILAGYGLIHLRHDFPVIWTVWLVLIVIVTDVVGYFAGKLIGGPKFWPKLSPKKTWSGTVAGWIGAAIVGLFYVVLADADTGVVGISVALSMAAQMGDIAESALKRRVGVKDSSNLLPGHGGFFDRFDGILGAAIFLLLIERIVDFPPLGV